MNYGINEDKYLEDAQKMSGLKFKHLKDIPDCMLIMVVRIRGYEGRLYKPQTDKPKIVRHKDGSISLKY